MRRKELALGLVILISTDSSAGSGASTEMPASLIGYAGEAPPLFQWAGFAQQRLGVRVCFEGARIAPGDSVLRMPAPGGDPVAAVVAASNATAYPILFRVVEVGGRQVIVPEMERDPSGATVPYSPVLDTPIDVAPSVRRAQQALEAWVAALREKTGENVVLAQHMNGEAISDAGGTNVVARDLLVTILDDISGDTYGPNLVWRMVWHEEEQRWILNIGRVWSLETPSGPHP